MTYTMPALLKDQWVDALLSGQYTQGTGTPYNNDTKKFCVMGVLMDVIAHVYPHLLRWNPMIKWWVSDTYFTPSVAIASLLVSNDLMKECIMMNDNDRMNFTELAQWINTNVEGV